ncbi:MAG: SCP2 sterol-binding domain-containing protein [Nitrospiraceae bacterium]
MARPTSLRDLFHGLPAQLDADAADGVTAVYQFDLSGPDGGQYAVAIDRGVCTVSDGMHPDPHVTLAMDAGDARKVLSGQLSGQMAVFSGRLRVSGDLGLAMQLRGLFPGMRA